MQSSKWVGDIVRAFDAAPAEVRAFLVDLPRLVADDRLAHGLSAALAYGFHRMEVAHRRALHAGLVRIHGVSPWLARRATQEEHLSREHLHHLLREVLRAPLPDEARGHLDVASSVRDDMLHGRDVSAASLRKALAALVAYAGELDAYCRDATDGVSPFGAEAPDIDQPAERRLTTDTSRYVLRGMGFAAVS